MCDKCNKLESIFTGKLTDYEYWLMSELFVYLHNGKDYCDNMRPSEKEAQIRELKHRIINLRDDIFASLRIPEIVEYLDNIQEKIEEIEKKKKNKDKNT